MAYSIFDSLSKKVEWYLSRSLAIRFPEDDMAIRLTFEPKGNGHEHDDYMVEERNNRCVCCGSIDGLTKHHVGRFSTSTDLVM